VIKWAEIWRLMGHYFAMHITLQKYIVALHPQELDTPSME
jgi:hypothetical protein